MSKACDECGADGIELECICEKENTAKPERVRPSNKSNSVSRSDVPLRRLRDDTRRPGHQPGGAPQAPPVKVKCCRCMNVHLDTQRINEWGVLAGKVMSGRMTWCPTNCGYHVTVPAEL